MKMERSARGRTMLLVLFGMFQCLGSVVYGAPASQKGFEVGGVEIKDAQGKRVGGYSGSYALLVGVSNYTAGWSRLENVKAELDKVEAMLIAQGFTVERWPKPGMPGPTATELEKAFEEFIDRYGYEENNRLLFFFSGHGYTLDDGNKGYLVPTDAPDPKKDEKGFRRKALNMDLVQAWAKNMLSKHAIFLFDSCFSGTIFKYKDLPDMPPNISTMTAMPVRQFITAGSADEKVPAKSTFIPMFIDAVGKRLADYNKDGYVTGTELGMYLGNEVPKYTHQTPQYGKIQDYELARGDFVFQVGVNEGSPMHFASPGITATEVEPYKAWPYIANDVFTDASLWWEGDAPDVNASLNIRRTKDGKYRAEVSFQKPWSRWLEAPYAFAVDFYVAVDVRIIEASVAEGASVSLLFGRASMKDYGFIVSSTNSFGLARGDPTSPTMVIDWTPVAVDLKKPNRLSVLVENQIIKLFINSSLVGVYRDPTFTGGKVGLGLGGWGVGRLVAEFDNFEYRRKP